MEIILLQDVNKLGQKDDIVNVKKGYATNFLVPQGYAVAATSSAKKMHAENLRQRAHKEEKIKIAGTRNGRLRNPSSELIGKVIRLITENKRSAFHMLSREARGASAADQRIRRHGSRIAVH